MPACPNSPKLLKGGIMVIDPATAQVRRIIVLQYNPESLNRTIQAQGAGGGSMIGRKPCVSKGLVMKTGKLCRGVDQFVMRVSA